MEFDIKDGISFVRTLTRNVLSLWDEVSTPRQENVCLFSQSEELISRDRRLARVSFVADVANDASKENKPVKPKPKKRLLFDERDKKTSETSDSNAVVSKREKDFPLKIDSNLCNRETGTTLNGMNSRGFRTNSLSIISGLMNFTFPLYMPLKIYDSRFSSFLKALNLTDFRNKNVKYDKATLRIDGRNNNSFLSLTENKCNCPKTSLTEDTLEFEKDIKFLSTVPNKMSTPIKAGTPNLSPERKPAFGAYMSSYATLADGLSKIFWKHRSPLPEMLSGRTSVFPGFLHDETNPSMKDYHLAPAKDPHNSPLRTPIFANEDEEAVYYLVTKYLHD